MRIVGICACCSGIAHTYMAKKAIVDAAQAAGDEIHLETQGTIGVEDELTPEQIAAADCVLLCVDVHVEGTDRFKGKKVMKIPTGLAIKAPKQIIRKLHEELERDA
ncbi:PTS fructose transporter subunit IIB [Olsenella sp. HMSC062G07]|uniref:PTS fructose transporter subunit IIB n=1 Tax=Olsenella sp. HMSC062G07 TaxID=1739330 RepID=UPI0008A300D2|nr:fructose PTS transporter subunit IIB [Olsenella sp. HMSC062G07]OFK23250.1 PTS fructose transporter subunit IIB [Olsenella sp. HMSC062G07]